MKIPSNIKAVIFDVDGLLIDSEPYWHETTEAFFAKHNKPFHQGVHSHIMGRSLPDIIEYFKAEHGFEGETQDLINQRKASLYEKLLPEITLMEGAEALIKRLQENGYPMIIATGGHSKEKMREILIILNIQDAFTDIITADQVEHGKPAPDIFLLAAKVLNVDPEDCLVLEDAPNGVMAGKAAGMVVYGVNKDEWWRRELEDSGADCVLTSLTELTS